MTITGKRPKRAAWFELAEAASVGIEMAVAIAIGWFGGRWLEANVTHWPPTRWIGLAFGMGAAVMAVVRTVIVFRRTLEEGELQLPEKAAAKGRTNGPANDPANDPASSPPDADADADRRPADDA